MKISSRSAGLAAFLFMTVAVPVSRATVADGDAALARFDLDAALAAYRDAHRQSPTDYDATWKLVRALADKATLTTVRDDQQKLLVEAEPIAREAVRLNPDSAKGHAYLAIVVGKLALFQGGKRKIELSKEVKADAEKALTQNPNEDLAHHVLGIWNREMVELNWFLRKFAELLYGRFPPASFDEAIAQLRRAKELAPTVIPHRVELGITLASARQWKEARAELESALTMPKGWVTDEYYWALAKERLPIVKKHA